MKIKRQAAAFLAAAMAFTSMGLGAQSNKALAADKTAADYSYTITPLLSPFNQYFFVKTANPDPMSFRFVDKTTVYGENGACGSLNINYDSWDEEMVIYADVDYEDESTGRVNGGYIFTGSNTDGGDVTLQYKKTITYSEYSQLKQAGESANIGEITKTTSSSSSGNVGSKTYYIDGYYKWEDTGVKVKLPKLSSGLDYLVDTYAVKDSFFDNMNAVQSGFSSVCLYSGSFIRGELYKSGKYWSMSTSPHVDQTFYIQSPYSRKDNESLFATALYPYRYDSLGFPSMMSSVAKKLSSEATVEWSSSNHYTVNVTYNGETKAYGGQGNGKGQAVTKDDILHTFTFDKNDLSYDLTKAKALLTDYAKLSIPDDVPEEDRLTWKSIWDRVGDGAWVRLTGITSVFGGQSGAYSYLYQKGDGSYFYTDSAGSNGAEIYWSGNLGYASDTWVDGRYVDKYECYVPGAKFDDHPTSSIIMRNFTFPDVTYQRKYNYDTRTYEYTDVKVTESKKNVLFRYDSTLELWTPDSSAFKSGTYFSAIKAIYDAGALDKKYYDMMTLTESEARAAADKNIDIIPQSGYIYNATAMPGTPFNVLSGDVNSDGKVNIADVIRLQQNLAGWKVTIDSYNADVNKDGKINIADVIRIQQHLAGWKVELK